MMQWIKIAGLSAILAAGVVTAFGDTGQAAPAPGKLFHDRLLASSDMPEVRPETRSRVGALALSDRSMASGKGDSRTASSRADCATQTWPYISAVCLTPVGEARAPRPVRTITVETRAGANTSVLARVSQPTLAVR
jgi:hypothetical protein